MSHAPLQRKPDAHSNGGTARRSSSEAVRRSQSKVQRVSPFPLGGIQRQVKVGSAHDPAEHEAEHTADHVTSGAGQTSPVVARLVSAQEGDNVRRAEMPDEQAHVRRALMPHSATPPEGVYPGAIPSRPSGTASIYRKTDDSPPPPPPRSQGDLDRSAARALTTKGPGEPMRAHVRRTLENQMGVDLGGVRVHEGSTAQKSAAELNARAFASGNNIWLGRGESQENTRLMAHEAAHVVQQGAAPLMANGAPERKVEAPVPAPGSVAETSSASTGTPGGGGMEPVSTPPAATPTVAKAGPEVSSGATSSVGPSTSSTTGAIPASASKSSATGKPSEAKTASGGPSVKAAAGTEQSGESKGGAKSPEADPAFAAVAKKVKQAGSREKRHAPAATKAAAAHSAVQSSANEVSSRAAARQTDVIDQQQPRPFNREAFKAALLKKIADTAPKTLEAADKFKEENNLGSVKSDLTAQVADEKKDAQGPLAEKVQETPDTSGIDPKASTPLPPQEATPAPHISAAGAAPKPASNQEISLDAGPKEINQQMSDAQVTEDQLRDSNEPAFQSALDQKKDVEKEAVAAPQAYRVEEGKLLQGAEKEAQSVTSRDAAGMANVRKHALTRVGGHQVDAKAEEESKRAKIFSDIEKIYETTKSNVEARLKKLDTDVNSTFDSGAAGAQNAFETYVDVHMSAYKDDRYGQIGGGLLWAKDKLFGLPDEVEEFYQKGHDLYVDRMDKLIDQIAAMVETGLNEAKSLVADGKTAIQKYVDALPAAEKETGKKAAEGIQSKFDELSQSINEKQDDLISSLAKKYNENLQKVNDRIAQMKEENSGLVHKVVGAIKGVIVTIMHLKDMLLNVLSRAASAISLIIAHPIKFLGNLVDAGKLGFMNFKDHIVEHLKAGFMQWLFGAVASTGIELPKTFDLAGILGLVLQVLGLTYANIRARAVNILGEKVVKALETTAEVFKVLITKGPAGLWEFIKDKLGNLIDMGIEKIKSFVMEKIIIAGVTWLIGLLNPASAFVKACKAIYDIIMFFVEHGSEILDLVNAIIDSITAIAKGQITQAANWVEKSLARAIPVIIGFLASLLGVGGIAEKIKEIIEAIRKPINDAIDWVIGKAVGLAKALGGALGIGAKEDERTAEQKMADLDKAMAEAGELAKQPNANAATVTAGLAPIKKKYRLNMLELDPEGGDNYEIVGGYSPTKKQPAKLKPGLLPTHIEYGAPDSRRGGTLMKASPLSNDHPVGSSPSAAPPIWSEVNQRRNDKRLYVLGHLLNQQLGGPGDNVENLTPITFSANALHQARVESTLKDTVNKDKKMVHYEVKVNYPSSPHKVPKSFVPPYGSPAEGELATSFSTKWWELVLDNQDPKKAKQEGSVHEDVIPNLPPAVDKYPQEP